MYLADGVGGFNEKGVDPGLYARVLTYEAAKEYAAQSNSPLATAGPKKAIQVAQENTRLPGASTMVIVTLEGTTLKAANLGDLMSQRNAEFNYQNASILQGYYDEDGNIEDAAGLIDQLKLLNLL